MQKARPTQAKRQRERAQADRRKEKFQRRQESKSQRSATPRGAGEDPDIAGIQPGPQRSPYDDMIGPVEPDVAEEQTQED